MTDTLPTPRVDRRQPRPPRLSFSFDAAIRQLFRTSGGADFGKRLWFWSSMTMAVVFLIAIPLFGATYLEMMRFNETYMAEITGGGDPQAANEAMFAMFGRLVPMYLYITLVPWFVAVAGEGALHRKIFHDTEPAGYPLRFGRDEWRIIVSQLAVFGLMFSLYFLGSLVGVLLGIITFGIGFLIIIPALIYSMFIIPLRLSTAGAIAVKDQRISIKESRAVTKHRLGSIFGAYAFVWVIGYVAITIIFVLIGVGLSGSTDIVGSQLGIGGDSSAIDDLGERLTSPVVMLTGIVGAVIYAAATSLLFLTLSGVGAYALRWYDADMPSSAFD